MRARNGHSTGGVSLKAGGRMVAAASLARGDRILTESGRVERVRQASTVIGDAVVIHTDCQDHVTWPRLVQVVGSAR